RGPQDHEEHQQERRQHHAPHAHEPQRLQQHGENAGAQDGSHQAADAAQIHHDQDFGGFDDVKVARVDKLQQVRKQAARHPREERSEEHTSELQSRENLVCRLLLEKKKNVIQSDVDETSGYG